MLKIKFAIPAPTPIQIDNINMPISFQLPTVNNKPIFNTKDAITTIPKALYFPKNSYLIRFNTL